MGHSLSANKRERQNEKRRQRNKVNKIAMRKELRKFNEELDKKEVDAKEAFSQVQKALDRAVKKNTIPKARANRKKARLAKALERKKSGSTK